ncbi:ABC transporter, permease protein [Chitinispirillum alkaliphilum]|nr:ABC transporter, permease protein [Chitinispirillum alkaliphilum]
MSEQSIQNKFYWLMSDFAVLTKRSAVYILRNLDQALSTLFTPIMFLLLFRYVFGEAIETPGIPYVDFLFAGILVQTIAFGSTYTAIGVTTDIRRGIVDRFKSLPMANSALLVGHTVTDLIRNTISTVIMILAGLVVGFRPTANVYEWILTFAILMLFTFAMSWLSAIMGLVSKSIEGVQWITFVVVFPITFISSAFVPTETMVPGLRAFAENQPITHVIEAVRALTIGTPLRNHGWLAILWSVGILISSYIVAVYLFNRKTTAI